MILKKYSSYIFHIFGCFLFIISYCYTLTRVELLNISTIMFVIDESNSLDIKTSTKYYKEHNAVKSKIIWSKK